MRSVLSQDYAIDCLIYHSKKKGIEKGRKEGKIDIARELIQHGVISFEALKEAGIYTEEELAAIAGQ